VSEYLFTQLVYKLIKAEINFSFYFVIQELLAENGEGVHRTVVVEIQGVQHVPVKVKGNGKFRLMISYAGPEGSRGIALFFP
jgi:hypothetical protein